MTFQHALSIVYYLPALCNILSPGNLESNIAIVLSSEQLYIIETSDVFHYTFFTFNLWWSDVKIFVCFDISHIFTVLSADPDANTLIFAWFNDNVITASVWLPYLNFLFWFENFLGFLFLLII